MTRYLSEFCMVAMALTCLTSTGCATLFSGSADKNILVTSTTPGVHFEIYNSRGAEVANGTTPNNVALRRSKGYFAAETYTIRTTAPGGAPREQVVRAGISPWYWGNIPWFIGLVGPIGMFIVDPLTGAMWDYQNEVKIDMMGPRGALSSPYLQPKDAVARDSGEASPVPEGQ